MRRGREREGGRRKGEGEGRGEEERGVEEVSLFFLGRMPGKKKNKRRRNRREATKKIS